MTHCVPLMKTRAHCQPVITAILQLMLDVTTKVIIYIEDNVSPLFNEFMIFLGKRN